jgi:hypothetical protein
MKRARLKATGSSRPPLGKIKPVYAGGKRCYMEALNHRYIAFHSVTIHAAALFYYIEVIAYILKPLCGKPLFSRFAMSLPFLT